MMKKDSGPSGEKEKQLVPELRKQLEALLTPQQLTSFKEMAFQNIAVPGLQFPDTLNNIGASDAQKKALQQIDDEYFDKPRQIYCELTDKALKAFTPAQQDLLRAELDRRGW